MNPFNLPKESFNARRDILLSSLESVITETSNYIYNYYPNLEKLEQAESFCTHELMEAPTARADHLEKVSIFPWVEAVHELDSCLTVIFQGNYKNAFDSLRRALELVVAGSFFVLDSTESEKAKKWMHSVSDNGTPNFKRALSALKKATPQYDQDNDELWTDVLLEHYWDICNVIHVNGLKNSFNIISPRFRHINGMGVPQFDKKACSQSLSYYLKTVELIALTVALSNPVLLVGFDMERKFGINPPMSGFYSPVQAENLACLIPDNFQKLIARIKETDTNISSIQHWYDSLPDITEEELNAQFERQDEFFKEFTKS
ncbi:hypothetical protein [Shewanella septentrionalis]|uniref:Uncharacterized protein n=1 Tax=Shewanella septentrionalis TaxID=2952223 RepID=A0A9X2WXA9_9GAMM|nr:hypothetical protein [Shewanella septentrionalis]MCT7947317.1 hypothetical protein [Shewanella septentrionalis]